MQYADGQCFSNERGLHNEKAVAYQTLHNCLRRQNLKIKCDTGRKKRENEREREDNAMV